MLFSRALVHNLKSETRTHAAVGTGRRTTLNAVTVGERIEKIEEGRRRETETSGSSVEERKAGTVRRVMKEDESKNERKSSVNYPTSCMVDAK